MMRKMLRKGIILGIIILFVGASVIPSINGTIGKISNISDMDVIENIGERENVRGQPPEEEWNKTFGGSESDNAYSVVQTVDGGYIIAGDTRSFGAGSRDVWLIKTDSTGDILWSKTLGGGLADYGYSVRQTQDAGYIVAGSTKSYGVGSYDVWLIKTDSTGDILWNRTFGGGSSDKGYFLDLTMDGGYIITGFTRSFGMGSNDVYLIKADNNGNMVWNKTFGGSAWDEGRCVRQTMDGGYIVVGYTYSFGPGENSVWLLKTDSLGDTLWTKIYGGNGEDYGWSVQQTEDEGYILTGYTDSYGSGEEDVWLIKTDVDGNEQWNKTFGGIEWDWGYSVQQTDDGGYIVTGWTGSFGSGGGDVWLIKTDSTGEAIWNRTFGGNSMDIAWSVQQTEDGGYILAGETYSYGVGSDDVWLIKVAPENNPPNVPSQPSGPTSGHTGVTYTYSAITTDPDGNDISYLFNWGDGSDSGWTEFVPSGTEGTASHSWDDEGTYEIKAKAKDIYDAESDWSDPHYITITGENDPPSTPNIEGETHGHYGESYEYTFVSIDLDDDDVWYYIEWGDGETEEWIGPYESGEEVKVSHTWDEEGTYTIKAKAKDVYDAESDWGTLEISMPRNKPSNMFFLQFLERLFEHFPLLEHIFYQFTT